MAENEGFTFGDFNFTQPQSLPVHGGLEDDEWGDFFVAASQPPLSNGFSQSHHLNPPSNSKPYSEFDPFSFGSQPSPIRADPGLNSSQKPGRALPLSLFGEADSNGTRNTSYANNGSSFDPNCPAKDGKIEVNLVSNGDVFGNLHTHSQKIKPDIGSNLNSGVSVSDLNNLDEGDDDEWEFTGAFPSNNGHVTGNEELGPSVSSKVELAAVGSQEKQAGPDVSSSTEHNHGSNNSVPQFVDLFAQYHGTFHMSNDTNVGLNNSSTSITPNVNGFMPNLFLGVEPIVNGCEISATSVDEDDDFDDFGDFIDASQAVEPPKQDHLLQPESSRGPLPMSLFSDGLDEPSDDSTHKDEMFDKPSSNPRKGVSGQGPGISINDLLSNLYSQAQLTPTIDSNTNPANNGVHSEDSTPYVGDDDDDDDWDDNSWEFKDAFSETGMDKQSSSASVGTTSQKLSDTTSYQQFYMDFYAKLRGSLCVLLSHELNEAKKSQSSDTSNVEKAEALSHDIQEAYKLLEGNITTEEYLSRKHLDKSSCLDEVFEALQGPKCKVIESEYSMSERLKLAMYDWRTATELLKHAISVLQILSLGSADEQSIYVSIWSKIITVCAQELKYGVWIWKRALDMNVQAQVLSDLRGQRYIQALGEIYKITELLRLSTRLYKPWMFSSMSNPQQPFGSLDECDSLWSSSGLEKALQNVSDKAANALMVSIKKIHDADMLAMHDSVFVERQSLCSLSLLPQTMLPGLTIVLWNEVSYFVNLANLWANLISRDPPQLPLLQVPSILITQEERRYELQQKNHL